MVKQSCFQSENKKRIIKKCSRCKCHGHRYTRCPIFIPKYDNIQGYIVEIERFKNLKLKPISNTKYFKKWINDNGGSRLNINLIYDFVQNQ